MALSASSPDAPTPQAPSVTTAGSPASIQATAQACVERYGDALYRFAVGQVGDQHVAEDLVQDTFLTMLRDRGSFRGDSAELTWLIGILKHKVADHFRRSGRETPFGGLEDDSAAHGGGDSGGDVADHLFTKMGQWKKPPKPWATDPSALMENSEFLEVFADCQGKLPKPMAEAFRLRVIEEMDAWEVCKVLELTPTNLWVRLHRARLRLRECLESKWFRRSAQR